jgi:hypothetical protein
VLLKETPQEELEQFLQSHSPRTKARFTPSPTVEEVASQAVSEDEPTSTERLITEIVDDQVGFGII